ncbi:hypothetical protein H0Z60_12125 [Ectothiorhodospiraceae bacterium WFHF3C12]|nr:hypothetical protein [Ectothiorhodospiraceae bacterium WFHF3C12]
MRLLLVGSSPETGHLAQSLVMAGSGSVVHCGVESEALRLVHSGVNFDWVLAEVNAAPSLAREVRLCVPPPLPSFTFLDWSRRESAADSDEHETQRAGAGGLVQEGESPWVLEYHVPRRRGSMA